MTTPTPTPASTSLPPSVKQGPFRTFLVIGGGFLMVILGVALLFFAIFDANQDALTSLIYGVVSIFIGIFFLRLGRRRMGEWLIVKQLLDKLGKQIEQLHQAGEPVEEIYPLLQARANILLEMERNNEALKEFSQMHKLRPEEVAPLFGMGQVMFRTGEIEAAGAVFDKALEIEPDNEEVLLERADAFVALKMFSEAEEIYAKLN